MECGANERSWNCHRCEPRCGDDIATACPALAESSGAQQCCQCAESYFRDLCGKCVPHGACPAPTEQQTPCPTTSTSTTSTAVPCATTGVNTSAQPAGGLGFFLANRLEVVYRILVDWAPLPFRSRKGRVYGPFRRL